jgi:hypothetical protein
MDIITDRHKARILSGATFLAGAVLVVLPLLAGPGYLPVIAFPALAGVGYLTVRAWRSPPGGRPVGDADLQGLVDVRRRPG